jgi:hypothetical protein
MRPNAPGTRRDGVPASFDPDLWRTWPPDERYPSVSSWESIEHIGPISRPGRRGAEDDGDRRAGRARSPLLAAGELRLDAGASLR